MTPPVPLTPAALLAWRQTHGLSQHALARHLGVSQARVSRWESGARTLDRLLPLALEALGRRLNARPPPHASSARTSRST